MKSFIVLALFVAAAAAAPASPEADAQITRYDSDNIGVGGYGYAFQTSNGIAQEEQGELRNPGTDNEYVAARGQFSYIGEDGKTYLVSYIADENGFQPQGEHLPKSP